jgi:radical SAM-linked protein
MDIFCTKWVSPHFFTRAVSQQLPPGIEILQVYPIDFSQPSLQSQVRYAEYKVAVETERDQKEIETVITSLLSLEHLPWHHRRDTGTKYYDLRALIDDLWFIDWYHSCSIIGMRLRCDSGGSGRPEQVTTALGFTHRPKSIHRIKLILKTG